MLLPTGAQSPKNAIKFPDGSTKTFASQDEVIDAFKAILAGETDGSYRVTIHGNTMSARLQGQRAEITADGKTMRGTRTEILFHMDQAQSQGQVTACKANLRNLATALKMWSDEHEGAYPDSLSVLAPNYVKYVPQCPANRRDTYSQTYHKTGPGAFRINCQAGHNKLGLPPGYPGWTSEQGMIEKP